MVLITLTLSQFIVAQLMVMDRERLNYSALAVHADYEVARAQMPYKDALNLSEWQGDQMPIGNGTTIKRGSWSVKNGIEKSTFVLEKQDNGMNKKRSSSSNTPQFKPRVGQLVYDERTFLFTDNDGKSIFAASEQTPMYINNVEGPFQCWDFPYMSVLAEFQNILPLVTTNEISGRKLPCSVYRKENDGAADGDFYQLEVTFDPDAGSLPMFMRRINYHKATDNATVQTRSMCKVLATNQGAFLPTFVFELRFKVLNFSKVHPNYTYQTIFDRNGLVATKLLLLKNLTFFNEIPSIKKGKDSALLTPGAALSLKNAPSDITLQVANSWAGSKKLESRLDTLPHFEKAEQTAKQSGRAFYFSLSLGIISILLGIAFFIYKKVKFRVIFCLISFLTCSQYGCGLNSKPELKISAEFVKRSVHYDFKGQYSNNPILVHNTGTLSIDIRGIEGGCTCRRISQGQFPFKLEPGHTIEVPAEIQLSSTSYQDHAHRITVVTDQGNFTLQLVLLALLENRVVPETVVNGSLTETDDWEFELTHRSLFAQNNILVNAQFYVDSDFSCQFLYDKVGYIPGPSETKYVDKIYKLSLKTKQIGSFRSIAVLRSNGNSLLSVPIVWTRAKNISFIPSRVILSDKSVRVFLRSAKPEVEIGSILSAPDWVVARVEGPRELTIRKRDGVGGTEPAGIIRVSTNDEKHETLELSILRVFPVVVQPEF